VIPLARKTLTHEWRRFVPAVLAITFSGLLLLVQAALVLGIFGSAAVSVTASTADLWVGHAGTQSVNFGRTISPDVEMALRMDPAVRSVEPYVWVEGDWHGAQRGGGSVAVYVSGLRTTADAAMFARILPPALRLRLREPGAVVVDASDLDQLGVQPGQGASINGRRVQVVGTVGGLRGLGGVNVLASLETARGLDAADAAGATYYVARLADPLQAAAVQQRLRLPPSLGPVQLWTAADFAERSQLYWLLDTGAGVAVLFMAAIVCLVGAVVTSQSLSAVVAASAREYATLNALGASVAALGRVVLEQALWVGAIGVVLAALASTVLLLLAARQHVPVAMTPAVALGCAVIVALLALLSGLLAVRGLVRADPALLLR
jgi:putative ABC transport system permease protein